MPMPMLLLLMMMPGLVMQMPMLLLMMMPGLVFGLGPLPAVFPAVLPAVFLQNVGTHSLFLQCSGRGRCGQFNNFVELATVVGS